MNTPLAERLHQRFRQGEAREVPFHDQAKELYPDLWVCHERAAKWVAEHPGSAVVPGWIVTPTSGAAIFDRHSVVDTGADLRDVTYRDDVTRQFLLGTDGWDGQSHQEIFVDPAGVDRDEI
jgi:hypothetical protein